MAQAWLWIFGLLLFGIGLLAAVRSVAVDSSASEVPEDRFVEADGALPEAVYPLRLVDTNQDGVIDFQEFSHANMQGSPAGRLAFFNHLDRNADSRLSPGEGFPLTQDSSYGSH